MKDKGETNRQKIIEAANALFYQRGYNQTSFSEIAEAAGIPRGNFYYYFKSKDEILESVIAQRNERIAGMLEQWEREIPEPRERLKRFVQILNNSVDDVIRYGCPMGSLNAELGKTQPDLQAQAAKMFSLMRDWLQQQFVDIGYKAQAKDYAMKLIVRAQGIALMTNVFSDKKLLQNETDELTQWVDAL